jgi:hypothetical protein
MIQIYASMNRVALGITPGVAFGVIDVLLMLPMTYPDKRSALLAAFSSRFALGFFAVTARLPWPSLVSGALVGVLISLPDAIVTKAYAPIMVQASCLASSLGGS